MKHFQYPTSYFNSLSFSHMIIFLLSIHKIYLIGIFNDIHSHYFPCSLALIWTLCLQDPALMMMGRINIWRIYYFDACTIIIVVSNKGRLYYLITLLWEALNPLKLIHFINLID